MPVEFAPTMMDKGSDKIKSCVLHHALPAEVLKPVIAWLSATVFADLDSPNGFYLTIDDPMNNKGLVNILRPAVFRQHYALDAMPHDDDMYKGIVRRHAYGTGSGAITVGTRDEFAKIKQMPPVVMALRNAAWELAKRHFKSRHSIYNREMLSDENIPNVCVLLNYTKGSKCDYHNDNTYLPNGVFDRNNSQKENTLVITVTLGAPRYLQFRRRFADLEKTKWMEPEAYTFQQFLLDHGSVSFIHPKDEIPTTRHTMDGYRRYGQFQHGVLYNENEMSTALIFRCATKTAPIYQADDSLVTDMTEKQYAEKVRIGRNIMKKNRDKIKAKHNMMKRLVSNGLYDKN
jgi:hypothetical protein